jgi:NADH-ubiquinone oxidoreductase chain 2
VYENKDKVKEEDPLNYKNINNLRDISNLKDVSNSPIQLIDQLKGYYYINPFLALSLSITLFSFVGVPPLIGFFAKQMVLSAALDNGYIFMVLIAILTSVISAVYYLAIIKQIFFDKPNYKLNPVLNNLNLNAIITDENVIIKKINFKTNNIVISSSLTLIISVLTLVILLFIFIPQE